MFARLYLVPYSQYKCIYQGIMIMSRKERKLDRLKINSEVATNEAPTCAVPMYAPQTSSLWRGGGQVGSVCVRKGKGQSKWGYYSRSAYWDAE